ncbi:MAG: 3-oxoacyl-ACP synthase III [Anaerolineae bacterium]|jgi:3-oxoacyl-[acyl-carrier-protein] synthase-3|nr:3-oxoacyl-ACP synthase III [Anaerolineae bacterium]
MQYSNVCIEGLGYVIPERVVTTAWFEEQLQPVYRVLGTPEGYIERLTGIKEHRWWADDVRVSDGSAWAGEKVLASTGVDRGEIQCLINTSVCRDYIEPATASIVHNKLGLSQAAMSFDIVNACLGFLNGMLIVANMIELGQIDTGMVVAAEDPREGQLWTIDHMLSSPPDRATLRDNLASFTLGSASVAMILRHRSRSQTGKRLLGGVSYSNTANCELCVAQRTWMRTKSSALLEEGTKVVAEAWQRFRSALGWTNDMVDRLFTHQVSEPQRQVALKALELSTEIDYPTLQYLGNTASVAAPISMAIGLDNGFVHDGDRVVLFGVGSGINSIVLGIQW